MRVTILPEAGLPAMEVGDETPTALYRFFNAAGRLLYVGITDHLKRRFEEHAAEKPWWPEVTRKTVQWYPTRTLAAEAELAAIRAERPLCNIQGSRGSESPWAPRAITPEDMVALMLSGLPPLSLKLAGLELAGMGTDEALDKLGVSRQNRYRVIAGRSAGQR
jgi:predicted GIY-YIG superfamily endonuclease